MNYIRPPSSQPEQRLSSGCLSFAQVCITNHPQDALVTHPLILSIKRGTVLNNVLQQLTPQIPFSLETYVVLSEFIVIFLDYESEYVRFSLSAHFLTILNLIPFFRCAIQKATRSEERERERESSLLSGVKRMQTLVAYIVRYVL